MGVDREIEIGAVEIKHLEVIARSRNVGRSVSQFAKAILLSADGLRDRDVAKSLRISRVLVKRWRNRYEKVGIDTIWKELPEAVRGKMPPLNKADSDRKVIATSRTAKVPEYKTRPPARKMKPKPEFLHVMQERGFVADCTDVEGLKTALGDGVTSGYIGFDATAKSLHAGSLIQIMMLRWLQKTGHKPIVLMGGGTSRVGDPSFRAKERPLLAADSIKANIEGIREIFTRFLDFGDNPTDAIMLDNAEWLNDLNYLDFLRDVGRYFSVNRMLGFDSVRSRLDREQSLSFLEFNYMILQAYDFAELNRRHGCMLQMGGSDQWGNIVNGVDLTRRSRNAEVFGLTSPLLTTARGEKMGKTAGGAVWLNSRMLSAYEFWQYWRNVDDADVERFLKLYTELPVKDCKRLGALRDSEINEAKIRLANEVTSLCHGRDAAQAAKTTASDVFDKGGFGSDLPSLSLSRSEIGDGISVTQLLVRSGLASSGKDARRLIAGSGVRVNGAPLTDAGFMLDAQALASPMKLSAGRKRHALVTLAD